MRPRIAGSVRPLVFVGLATVAAVSTACASVTAPAVEVNDRTVDRTEVNEVIDDALADPATAEGFATEAPGTATREGASFIVTQFVVDEVVTEELEGRDVEVTEADRAEAQTQLEGIADTPVAEWFEGVVARQTALIRVLSEEGADSQAVLVELVERADIRIDPRYGSWDAVALQVIPPAGPAFEFEPDFEPPLDF